MVWQCDPPDRPVVVPKERSPIVLYIHYLLYSISSKQGVDNVISKLRKMHWEDQTVSQRINKPEKLQNKADLSNRSFVNCIMPSPKSGRSNSAIFTSLPFYYMISHASILSFVFLLLMVC